MVEGMRIVAGVALTLALIAVATLHQLQLHRTSLLQSKLFEGSRAGGQKLNYMEDYWPKQGTCDGMRAGAQQSPIAIIEAQGGNVQKVLAPAWGWVLNQKGGLFRIKTPGTREDTGVPGQTIFVDGNNYDCSELDVSLHYKGFEYKLESFKLKTPSEHTINGQRFALEQQFKHTLKGKSAYVGHHGDLGGETDPNWESQVPGQTLMVSVVFSNDPLESPTYLDKLYQGLNCLREGIQCHQTISFSNMARTILFQTREAAQWWKTTYDFNWLDSCLAPPCIYGGRHGDHVIPLYLQPDTRANLNNYFRYEGSLTDPPCTEGVEWIVLKNALPISQDYAEEFRRTLGDIARQVQPNHGRVVQEVEPRM